MKQKLNKSLIELITPYQNKINRCYYEIQRNMYPLKLNKKERLVKECLDILLLEVYQMNRNEDLSEFIAYILEEGLKTKKIDYLQSALAKRLKN